MSSESLSQTASERIQDAAKLASYLRHDYHDNPVREYQIATLLCHPLKGSSNDARCLSETWQWHGEAREMTRQQAVREMISELIKKADSTSIFHNGTVAGVVLYQAPPDSVRTATHGQPDPRTPLEERVSEIKREISQHQADWGHQPENIVELENEKDVLQSEIAEIDFVPMYRAAWVEVLPAGKIDVIETEGQRQTE